MNRTYGTLSYDEGHWLLAVEPHVAMWAKRVFPKIATKTLGVLRLPASDAVASDLRWFLQRFPLTVLDGERLAVAAERHRERILTLDEIVGGRRQQSFAMALAPRAYQAVAAALYLAQGFLLLGDDVGLGKTASAIASFCDGRTLPACVITLTHLPRQWQDELHKFMPSLTTHIIKRARPYELPQQAGCGPDVLILNYHKLAGWVDVLAQYCKSAVWDECQELRKNGSNKYFSARQLNEALPFVIGLSATPIYNFGGEIFNVLDAMRPGVLGTSSEFAIEWCEGNDRDKARLKDPVAFGSYLREQHIMLRRTRADVGRELPPLQKITQTIDCDASALEAVNDTASELARIILSRSPQVGGDKMRASEEFNNLLRQATGIAKAPFVAAFVQMLVEGGESVLLYGWHRAVYQIWLDRLGKLEPAMYTGTESPTQKQQARDRFIAGETPVLIMSLRSGAGLDGLQQRCRTVVFGELDWSPGVHEQCIGRVGRDGQGDSVAAYFLLAEEGADPIMAETLGLKREQIEGLRSTSTGLERLDRSGDGIRRLAERYLTSRYAAAGDVTADDGAA